MEEVKVIKNAQSDFEVLHELTRKELISDLIMDCLYDAIYIDSRNEINFNSYYIKDSVLMGLIAKYDKKRFDEVIARLKEEIKEEKENG